MRSDSHSGSCSCSGISCASPPDIVPTPSWGTRSIGAAGSQWPDLRGTISCNSFHEKEGPMQARRLAVSALALTAVLAFPGVSTGETFRVKASGDSPTNFSWMPGLPPHHQGQQDPVAQSDRRHAPRCRGTPTTGAKSRRSHRASRPPSGSRTAAGICTVARARVTRPSPTVSARACAERST